MANTLVVGRLIGCRRRRNHRFHSGFQTFGATALGLYIAGMWLYPDTTGLHFHVSAKPFRLSLTTIHVLIWDAIPVVTISLSQFAFAMVGGFLFSNFRIR